MGVHTKRHEDGYGAGWAEEQWVSGSLIVGGNGGWTDAEARGSTHRCTEGWEGNPWTEEQGGWAGKRKAQETFIYVIIFHAAHTPSSNPTGVGKH